jgi:hypothetical protein
MHFLKRLDAANEKNTMQQEYLASGYSFLCVHVLNSKRKSSLQKGESFIYGLISF